MLTMVKPWINLQFRIVHTTVCCPFLASHWNGLWVEGLRHDWNNSKPIPSWKTLQVLLSIQSTQNVRRSKNHGGFQKLVLKIIHFHGIFHCEQSSCWAAPMCRKIQEARWPKADWLQSPDAKFVRSLRPFSLGRQHPDVIWPGIHSPQQNHENIVTWGQPCSFRQQYKSNG